MTDQPLRPIWTPEDALQAARDAANEPVVVCGIPARPTIGMLCPSCAAWPGEECAPGCITQMSTAEALRTRDEVLDRTLDELGLTPAPTSPPKGRGCAPGPVGLRPRRAAQRAKAMLCVAVILMMLVGGVLWASEFGALPR